MAKEASDIFVANHKYPEVNKIFNTGVLPLSQIQGECIFVLDTNALLVPYKTGSDSLDEIAKVYKQLKEQRRILIPGQVMREFANNRPEKLKEVFQQINKKQNSSPNLSFGNYPLLESFEEYQAINALEKEINAKLLEYRKLINQLTVHVKQWTWNDPVSLIYAEIFTDETILDLTIEQDKVKKDLDYRYAHKIPPGYKDQGKEDDGIGDLLVWLTILDVAKTKNQHVVFVSGDEKPDWYHRSDNQFLYPRFELVSEFGARSEGKSFHIVRLSTLLEMFGASEGAITEVKTEEIVTKPLDVDSYQEFANSARSAVYSWCIYTHNVISIKSNDNIIPDITLTDNNGIRTAIVVVPIIDFMTHSDIEFVLNDIMITVHGIQRHYDKYYIVFVADIRKVTLTILDAFKQYASKYIIPNTTYFYGYLGENGELTIR